MEGRWFLPFLTIRQGCETLNGAAISEPLRGHEDWVIFVTMIADGGKIVSGSKDMTVSLAVTVS